jgi:tetratricopeptide (TPR) repeat protein
MSATRSRSSRPSSGTVASIVLALSFAIYAPSLTAQPVSDDLLAIAGNEHVTGPFEPAAIFTTFSWWGSTRADAPGYRPLVTLSFALDRGVADLAPAWMHAVNIFLHALVSWLIFELALRIGYARSEAFATAVAFCVLPVHSEAVIWAVGRAELMAAMGFSAALVLMLEYRRGGRATTLALVALSFLGALFSKENAVTLLAAPPLVAMLLPGPTLARRRDAMVMLVLVLTLACYVGMRAYAGDVVGSAAGDQLDNALSVLGTRERLIGALSVLGRYLALTAWPYPLSVDYSYDALGIAAGYRGDVYAVVAIAACAGFLVWAWRQRAQRPAVTFAVALFFATYSIISNVVLVIGTAMAERLFYLPTVGLCLASAPGLGFVAAIGHKRGRHALLAIAAVYALVTFKRAGDWQTPVTLFEAATAAHPRSARAHMELGSAYGHAGRIAEAVAAFNRATAILPDYAAAWYNLGNLHARRGNYDEAIVAYEKVLTHAPDLSAARYNMALVQLSRGQRLEAAQTLRTAATASPHDPAIAMTLGDVYLALGRNEDAATEYSRVLAIEPRAAAARLNRGVALERSSGCAAALVDYEAALELRPDDRNALGNAVACLRMLERGDEAARLLARQRVANQ